MRIRIANDSDGAGVAAIYAPIVEHTFISFEETPPSPADMASRISATLKTHPWLIAEHDGDIAGYAYAGPHRSRAAYRWSCDVSVYVAETARRKGVARQLYAQLFDTLIRQGFGQAFAGIALPNAASVGVHERMGFEPIGIYPRVGFKNGSWRDVGWWVCTLQELSDRPAPPLIFADHPECFVTEP